jgi:hypothetical protein
VNERRAPVWFRERYDACFYAEVEAADFVLLLGERQDMWSTIVAANEAGSATNTVWLRARPGSVSQGAWFTKKRLNVETIAVSK